METFHESETAPTRPTRRCRPKLPKVVYDSSRFAGDGTVFMDLVRHPESNACYQCHSNRHRFRFRNRTSLDSRRRRAFARREWSAAIVTATASTTTSSGDSKAKRIRPSTSIETLSCAGCHIGADHSLDHDGDERRCLRSRDGTSRTPGFAAAAACRAAADSLRENVLYRVPRWSGAPRRNTSHHDFARPTDWVPRNIGPDFELPAVFGPIFRKGGERTRLSTTRDVAGILGR